MKSFEKVARILALYTMDRPSLSISEIQEELNLPKSTIFRILNALEKADYIEKNPDTHRYALGFNLFRLGSIVQNQMDFRSLAIPIMNKIVKETEETVELNIIDGLSRICVEKVDSPLDVRNFIRIGERKPLNKGASGKVLMAFLEETEKNKVIEQLKVQDESVDLDALLTQLGKIKCDGWCVTRGERVEGSFAVSAPVFGSNGKMVASLTIAGPIQRLAENREQDLVTVIKRGAEALSNRLGCFWTS